MLKTFDNSNDKLSKLNKFKVHTTIKLQRCIDSKIEFESSKNHFYYFSSLIISIPISLQPDEVKVFRAGNFRMVDIRINA